MSAMPLPTPLFSLGRALATPGALAAFERTGESPHDFLARHASGDWGDVDASDRELNDKAVLNADDRIFSAYHLKDGTKIYVITEWDRSATTLLLPGEY